MPSTSCTSRSQGVGAPPLRPAMAWSGARVATANRSTGEGNRAR
jgi:hypothetical protein